jgi:phosphoribosyl 1,2-cyclic phosphodiesterase
VTDDAPPPVVAVRFWGVRGSVPSPGAATARYGGNTPCVELRAADGRRLVLDAGTGLRPLGDAMTAEAAAGAPAAAEGASILVTHAHSDHVQGLPFFAPLSRGTAPVIVYAAESDRASVEAAIASLLRPPLFPHADGMLGRLRVATLAADGVVAGFRVRPLATAHPGGAAGFRVTCEAPGGGADARTVVYIPDNELAAMEGECGARRALLDDIAGADLLIHDATYLPSELAAHRGWGHSSYAEAVRLASDAGVRRLALFHHAPARDDAAIDRLARVAAAIAAASRGAPEVVAAAEGDAIAL